MNARDFPLGEGGGEGETAPIDCFRAQYTV
jgi:hypothetical protein